MTATATETTPGSRTSPPKLPVELQGRIIRHALLVPSGAPLPLDADTPYSIEWDQYAGDIGREARSRLAVQRAQATREALNLMRVSKAWKVDPRQVRSLRALRSADGGRAMPVHVASA